MNRTATVLVSFASGLVGAGIAHALKSNDTIRREGVTTNWIEPNSKILNPIVRISEIEDEKFRRAVEKSREFVRMFKDSNGIPGLVVGVSVDGKIVWEEGFGYANLETRTPCHVNTVMRIASISKPLTATLLAKLWEKKKIDLDKSVHEYVPYFPRKKIDEEEVDITIRQLASHTAGVRHYTKKGEKKEKINQDSGKEFYFKEKIDTVEKSVEFFMNDELLFKPGTSFEYTTHGYTLLSAAIESAGGKSFTQQIQNLFKILDLRNTHLDRVETLIHGRASYYDKNKHGQIVNAQLADTSYKWAGGGIVSTVGDLLKFGNAMLYSYQQAENFKPGYLKRQTVQEMWTSVENTTMKWGENSGYGLGWTIVPKSDEIGGVAESQKFHVGHSGGAVGASSVLMIFPNEVKTNRDENQNVTDMKIPRGVVVAILVNLEHVSCRVLGKNIAEEFYNLELM